MPAAVAADGRGDFAGLKFYRGLAHELIAGRYKNGLRPMRPMVPPTGAVLGSSEYFLAAAAKSSRAGGRKPRDFRLGGGELFIPAARDELVDGLMPRRLPVGAVRPPFRVQHTEEEMRNQVFGALVPFGMRGEFVPQAPLINSLLASKVSEASHLKRRLAETVRRHADFSQVLPEHDAARHAGFNFPQAAQVAEVKTPDRCASVRGFLSASSRALNLSRVRISIFCLNSPSGISRRGSKMNSRTSSRGKPRPPRRRASPVPAVWGR